MRCRPSSADKRFRILVRRRSAAQFQKPTEINRMKMHLPFLAGAVVGLFAASARSADPVPADVKITFNKHIAPLVFERCAGCHRPGEVAPFSLLSYGDVKKRSEQIAKVTADRFMPPWKSVEGHGKFL